MVSPANDPTRPEARRALSDMQVGYGSLEHLETRSEAARSLAAENDSPQKRAVSDGQVQSSNAFIDPRGKRVGPKRRAGTPASEVRSDKRRRAS